MALVVIEEGSRQVNNLQLGLEYQQVEGWPPLAWLARCTPSSSTVTVFHGSGVEYHSSFFCEAVWSGEFEAGDFDRTDIVSGTGGRLRDGKLTFVSPGTTVDRLHALESDERTWVSNSLACLMSVLDGSVDPTYKHYFRDFYTVVFGLEKYKRYLETTCGSIRLLYFENFSWNTCALSVESKPNPNRDFSTFERYEAFLESQMYYVAQNMKSVHRRIRYSMLGTLSSGYDSSAITALASSEGCTEAVCFDRTYRGQDDSGEPIAKQLGVRPIHVPIDAWRQFDLAEIPFIAANAMGEEARFRAAESQLANRVLMTGYHGDKMWGKSTKNLSPELVRGDPSGLGLSEYRLWAGFIHCAPAFWGGRQILDLNRISNLDAMHPWDVPGDYSRPICRRIVESRGVERELFGVQKRNSSTIVHNYDELLSPSSREDFLTWIREQRGTWLRAAKIPPIASHALDKGIYDATSLFTDVTQKLPVLWRLAALYKSQPTYLRRLVFPWALERAIERYDTPLSLIAD